MMEKLVDLIVRTLKDLAASGEVELPATPLGDGVALFGDSGLLDSVGLVTLVVAVEQAIEDQLGRRVSLADERALSQRHSPYRTVASLADYASGLLAEAS